MPIYAFEGRRPRIARDAFVHPDAVLIGGVSLGSEASVWPGAVLRADFGEISVGARTSVQDGTVVHTTEEWPTIVGADCVIGHNAHLEGCTVEDHCLVGSMSVVLTRARVRSYSVVGAAALVPEGLDVPEHSMVLGVPGRIRPLTGDEHLRWIEFGVGVYTDAARRYPAQLRRLDPDDCREP